MSRSGQSWRLPFGWMVLLGALHLSSAALAAPSGVPQAVQTAIPNARLAGEGDFRWLGLKIYRAQMWVGEQGYQINAPYGARFALELQYARTLYGNKIAQSSIDEMQKLGLGSPAQHQAWLADMEKLFPDVTEGSRITGVYLPDTGAGFYLDGKPLGTVRDPEFGRAFFAIWLDPQTSAPGLRKDLLREAAPRP